MTNQVKGLLSVISGKTDNIESVNTLPNPDKLLLLAESVCIGLASEPEELSKLILAYSALLKVRSSMQNIDIPSIATEKSISPEELL